MSVPIRYAMKQGPMIRTVLRSAQGAIVCRFRRARPFAPPTSYPVLTEVLPPRDPGLVREYLLHVGGDPEHCAGILPPHFFPQWGFPLLAQASDGLPYDRSQLLNAGVRMESHRPLPMGEALSLRACLEEVDDNGSRVIIKSKLITETASAPEALVCHVQALIRLRSSGSGEKREKPKVPEGAKEIDAWTLSSRSGWEYAVLTGDFNPVHWVWPYARLMGFRGLILHGFSQMARSFESAKKTVYAERPEDLKGIEMRFVRPLGLPNRVKVFVDPDQNITVGKAPGEDAYLTGRLLREI